MFSNPERSKRPNPDWGKYFLCPLLLRNYSMYDLIPLIEVWLEREGFLVSVLANRIDGTKKTGFFSSEKITVFLEDYPGQCSIRLQGTIDVRQNLQKYLHSLPPKEKPKDKEIIIRERETVSVPCPYCKTLVSVTEKRCPNCGAYLRG